MESIKEVAAGRPLLVALAIAAQVAQAVAQAAAQVAAPVAPAAPVNPTA